MYCRFHNVAILYVHKYIRTYSKYIKTPKQVKHTYSQNAKHNIMFIMYVFVFI